MEIYRQVVSATITGQILRILWKIAKRGKTVHTTFIHLDQPTRFYSEVCNVTVSGPGTIH